MLRDFATRADLTAYLVQQFPDAVGEASPQEGGRRAALARLEQIQPGTYGKSRNYLTGAVTRLSPYIRHGVLTLAEVRDFALRRVAHPTEATKFITELAWRDYWQRLYALWGRGIHQDREAYKTGQTQYAQDLPDDIRAARTGLACMDAFVEELQTTGYLHNHARMWMAAYVVHFRRVRWQAGANWFLEHLLDGDPASNHLSWQWVASTFSHRPYFFNRENLETYTQGIYCRRCSQRGHCDFEGSYDELSQRLFAITLDS